MNHEDSVDNIKFDKVILPYEKLQKSKLIEKVNVYLVDKVDKNKLNNVLYQIEHKRENITFNDDVYFDVIKVLTDNNKLGVINIDYADLVYQMVKDDNDYSFFLRIIPYVCEWKSYDLFKKSYDLVSNKNILISIFKKIEEIEKYLEKQKLSKSCYNMHVYYLGIILHNNRNYFIDDKAYLSFVIDLLNKYLKDNTYIGKYDFRLKQIIENHEKELISKEYNLIELEDNINSISNIIDITKKEANTTINNIDDIINKLDNEIESIKNKITESIKNNIDNKDDKLNQLINIDYSTFNKQKDEVYDLIDTNLDKQKKQMENEQSEIIENIRKENNQSIELDDSSTKFTIGNLKKYKTRIIKKR